MIAIRPAGRPATARSPRPAVFLDKDGTLVVDVPYNVDPAKLRFTAHAFEALRQLMAAGFALVIVSNQSGIARGLFDEAAWQRLARALLDRLQTEGIAVEAIHACPHGPDSALCGCRKPAPGMLLEAASVHGLDLARSWMIGDILDDIEAGHRAGCRAILLDVGNETVWSLTALRRPDHRCADLRDAAQVIVRGAGASLAA